MSDSRPVLRSSLPMVALLGMTAIWGSTFFLIKDLITRLPVADMLALRFALATGAFALIAGRRLRITRRTLGAGTLLGLLYGVAQILQNSALAFTSASASGFVTGLYVVATPLLAAVVFGTRISRLTWAAVALATAGLAVLSLHGLSVGAGEALTALSALCYAAHIVLLGRTSRPGEALSLTLVQLAVIALISVAAACWPDDSGAVAISLPASAADWAAVAYLGLVAGALTILLQVWAQARVEATRAAVVMVTEPVWAAVFAVALGGETITIRMLVGGMTILAAMVLVDVAPRRARLSSDEPALPPDREQVR